MMSLSTVHSSDDSDTAAHDDTEYCTQRDDSDTAADDGTEYCTQQ